MAIVNNTKLRTQLQSLERLAPKIDTERTGKKYTFIFPFSIILGAVNYTNLGEVADNVITNNATAYKLLFSGNENVIIQ